MDAEKEVCDAVVLSLFPLGLSHLASRPREPAPFLYMYFLTAGGRRQDTSDAARALFKKNQGNASFKENDFQQAAVFYTESLLLGLTLSLSHAPSVSFFPGLGGLLL